MQLSRFDNLIAIKTDAGRLVGFHTRNMQVAALDPLVWQALSEPELATPEARAEVEEWNQEVDPAAKDAEVSQAIRSFTINVAQVCNLKCTYCAAGGDGTYGSKTAFIDLEKTYQQLRLLLAAVPNGEKFKITFLGGEPLTYPEAIDAIDRFVRLQTAGRQIRLVYDLTTNATLVTPEIAELLARLKCHVTVSLDGPASINDRFRTTRGGRPSTERTLKGVAELMKVKDRLGSLGVNSVFGAHSCEVVSVYGFLSTFGWDWINFSYAAGAEDETFSPKFASGVCQVADQAFAEGGERELRKIADFDHLFRILDGQSRILNHCGAGKTLLQVDTEGRYYVCNWFVNDSTEEVGRDLHLDQQKIAKYADPLIELNNCQTCWARHLCGGGCMFVNKTKTGNKHQSDEQFCHRTRTILAKGIELYEQARNRTDRSCED